MPSRRPSMYACAVVLALAILAHPAAIRAPVQQQFSSFALIDQALEAGAIDAETADRYRIFAAFSDTRLPAAYQGDDSNMSALPPEVAGVGERMQTYSAATQAELAPFFMRPGDAGSWIELSTVPGQDPTEPDGQQTGLEFDVGAATSAPGGPAAEGGDPSDATAHGSSRLEPTRITWHTVSAVGGKAKVWWQDRYPGDAAIAQGLANELTSVIWPRLTRLMNQEPVPDNGIVNNGGDAALDFYLVHAPTNAQWIGMAAPAVSAAPCHPARYILIDTRSKSLGSASTWGVIQIATHELMHAITFAYRVRGGCPAVWIGEASGDWASNWLYPRTDAEHTNAAKYVITAKYQIDNGLTKEGYDRFYGVHLLPLFLENATGGAGFMPRMWANFRTMDVFEGIGAVMPGGFEKSWPRFLNQLWNRPPVDAPNGFRQWDRFNPTPGAQTPHGQAEVVNVTSQFQAKSITFLQADPPRAWATGIQPIAGEYRHYEFTPSVRAVTFHNTIHEEAITHGTVWAIEKIGGTWKQPIDLTEEWQKYWCRDNAQENLEELVLIFGNVDWRNRQVVNPQDPPALEAHAIGCKGWTGTTSQTIVTVASDVGLTIREHVTSTIRFEVDSMLVYAGMPPEHWKSVGGVLSWNITVSGKCSGGKSGGTAIVPDSVEHFATMSLWRDDNGRMHHSATGHWRDADPLYPIVCPEGPGELEAASIGSFFSSDVNVDTLATDGKSFTGQYTTRPSPEITMTTRYSFRCQGC